MTKEKPTCGRCGVYRFLHPTNFGCEKPRLSFWWDRHSPVHHVAGAAWLALPEKWRWVIVGRMHDRKPHLCWCGFVDAAYLDVKRDDFRGEYGCTCDVPLPTEVGPPRPGWCYCAPLPLTRDESAG